MLIKSKISHGANLDWLRYEGAKLMKSALFDYEHVSENIGYLACVDRCLEHLLFHPGREGFIPDLADVILHLLKRADRTGMDVYFEYIDRLAKNRRLIQAVEDYHISSKFPLSIGAWEIADDLTAFTNGYIRSERDGLRIHKDRRSSHDSGSTTIDRD